MSISTLSELLRKKRKQIFKPLPKLTLSEWADTYRALSSEASAEPGRWQTSRAEYQRGIMDAISKKTNERIVVMSSAQIGKTEFLLNLMGYYIHQEPSPILCIQPTIHMAQDFSKDRVAPMVRDTKVITDIVADPKSRDGDNTILHKGFPGGHLTLAGANAPSQLASRPIRVLLCDEVDRFPLSAGTEGDPLKLGIQRTSNFYNRKIVLVSTPTVKGVSRIEQEYELSSKGRYHIQCSSCEGSFVPHWRHVEWERDDEGHHPETAVLACPHCPNKMGDAARNKSVSNGEWRHELPDRKVQGFHLTAIISPWVRLTELVEEWLSVQGRPDQLRTFINTKLGETYEDAGEGLDNIDLLSRREEYTANTIPKKAVVLTAGVDVQKDRVEVEVVAWGAEEESWSVDFQRLYGDPSTVGLWSALKDYLQTDFYREDGLKMRVNAACIDSGGMYTQQAYAFSQQNKARRWWAIKGAAGFRPAFPKRPSKSHKYNAYVYVIGVDSIKETLYRQLVNMVPGPGYCHFSEERDDEYFTQLTCERKKVTFSATGRMRIAWIKPDGVNNEALDCRVYACAARVGLNPNITKLARKYHNLVKKGTNQPEPLVEPVIPREDPSSQEQMVQERNTRYTKKTKSINRKNKHKVSVSSYFGDVK